MKPFLKLFILIISLCFSGVLLASDVKITFKPYKFKPGSTASVICYAGDTQQMYRSVGPFTVNAKSQVTAVIQGISRKTVTVLKGKLYVMCIIQSFSGPTNPCSFINDPNNKGKMSSTRKLPFPADNQTISINGCVAGSKTSFFSSLSCDIDLNYQENNTCN